MFCVVNSGGRGEGMKYVSYDIDTKESKVTLVKAMVYIHSRTVNVKSLLQVH